MTSRDTGTEQLIKNTAKRLFFAEGKLHATTQEIADAAGVNRTLVNYYFRSRDALFDQVFNEAQDTLFKMLDEVMESDMPFKQKIENLISVFLKEALQFPYRELFLITEMNRHDVINAKKARAQKVNAFLEEIQQEMEKGTIKAMNPRHFTINLFSLMAYPLVTAPLNKILFGMNDDDYTALMEERKQLIFELIFP
ncbi:MAG: TetR/AcrR family transcriptional regulator [Candidatus Pedobacter colombiensis]|uniref:TetR/AcrR family transcriptional regulator n=1 Tax=Candidatus Pedobacter colombiensis TaxID=3121371 RepID=A0AAJ6B7W8_9SPHI|nr:TetR/AcrR family transcriptional regulator [Pedobacter sp.]WEK20314.1 MAG: TetR/AcrR family transcriptional regulator [Pedobacter sp.]